MRRLLPLVIAGLLLCGLPARAQTDASPVTVFAAASLTNALRDIAMAWAKQNHPEPRLSFAASSTLARQIEQGAPANIFASADEQWMNYLAKRDLIQPDTRKDLLTNRLVLVVPADHPARVTIGPGLDLAAMLGNGRLAIGAPSNVPAGIYAEQALKKLGIWAAVEHRLAPAEDVRAALFLVERGEAPAGIVYATDAASTKGVAIAGVFPPDSHDPIRYPVAIVRSGDTPATRALLDFIDGPDAKAIFVHYGFSTE